MDKIYFIVVINGFKKNFLICDKSELFKNEYYEFYFKFKFINQNQIELVSDLHPNKNLSFSLKILLEVAKNMFSFIIKKNQIFKLKREIDFNQEPMNQLKKNKVISYLYNNQWYDFPDIDSIIKKIKG
jgi:hypothetical protein